MDMMAIIFPGVFLLLLTGIVCTAILADMD